MDINLFVGDVFRPSILTSFVERLLEGVSQFNDRFENILDRMGQSQAEVEKYTSLIDSERQKRMGEGLQALSLDDTNNRQELLGILSDLRKPIDRMERRIESLQDNLQSKQRAEILNWLSPIPYRCHHERAHSEILLGTGAWLLEDDNLIEWRKTSSSSILWLHGIPGSGKSKLV